MNTFSKINPLGVDASTPHFNTLIKNYLSGVSSLQPFYNRSSTLKNFYHQISDKKNNYPLNHRTTLVKSLTKQYAQTNLSEKTLQHIYLLKRPTTFTVTTGHQLCLMTGPLYVLYKIIHTINLAKKLKETYPNYDFVPVYWMASEDHDFQEVNHFKLHTQNITWQTNQKGSVGDFTTENFESVYEKLKHLLGISPNANELKKLFKKSYLKEPTLAKAMHFLINELFADEGLVILDGDDKALKKLFVSYLKNECNHFTTAQKVNETNEKIKKLGYKTQVNPREINLFYKGKGFRKRIVKKENGFSVLDTDLFFTAENLQKDIENHPENYSPNVLMRPLYQEVILPNLAYVGGAGELSYWLQLRSTFDVQGVTFPILTLRKSLVLLTQKQVRKIKKMNGMTTADFFLPKEKLKQKYTQKLSDGLLDFTPFNKRLQSIFDDLQTLSQKTHEDFSGALRAQKQKQIKGLQNLEKRLLRAEQKKHQNLLQNLEDLHTQLFPNGVMQERVENFSTYFLPYGQVFLDRLKKRITAFGTVVDFYLVKKGEDVDKPYSYHLE